MVAGLLWFWLWLSPLCLAQALQAHADTPYCGEHIRTIEHGGQNRQYTIFVPDALCGRTKSVVFMGLHCYGCRMGHEVDKYRAVAESFPFVLVAPQGLQNSWNAVHCCGPALRDKADDLGFIDLVAQDATALLGQSLDTTPVVVAGFSNGAYLAEMFLSDDHHRAWVAGVVSLAGHQYAEQAQGKRPVPVLSHHSKGDTMVRYDGCCDGAGCCCDIDTFSGTECVSAPRLAKRWRKMNGCGGVRNRTLTDLLPSDPVRCEDGVGCHADTLLCTHLSPGHTDWAKHHPGPALLVEFVQRALCARHGTWRQASRSCECRPGQHADALHSCTPGGGRRLEDQGKVQLMALGVVGIAGAVIVLLWRTQMAAMSDSRPTHLSQTAPSTPKPPPPAVDEKRQLLSEELDNVANS